MSYFFNKWNSTNKMMAMENRLLRSLKNGKGSDKLLYPDTTIRVELNIEADAADRLNFRDLLMKIRKQQKEFMGTIQIRLVISRMDKKQITTEKVVKILDKYKSFRSLILDQK